MIVDRDPGDENDASPFARVIVEADKRMAERARVLALVSETGALSQRALEALAATLEPNF